MPLGEDIVTDGRLEAMAELIGVTGKVDSILLANDERSVEEISRLEV